MMIMEHGMRSIRFLALGAALLAAVPCAVADPALHAPSARITDSVIRADEEAFQALLQRLMAVNAAGVPADGYAYAKAMHWWEFAYDEFTENDRSGIVQAAYAEALRLVDWLEGKGADPGRQTPLLADSARIREDLWALAAELAAGPQDDCAHAHLARLEVQLVWAGHEYQELGWRHALPYVREAEGLAKTAKQARERCAAAQPSVVAPAMPAPASDAAPAGPISADVAEPAPQAILPQPTPDLMPPQAAIAELADLGQRIYFAYKRAELSAESQALLDRLAAILMRHPALQVELRGHADSRGSALYNLYLSLRRAEVVKDQLLAAGVSPRQIRLQAMGEGIPAVRADTPEAYARNRRVEILPLLGESAAAP